MLADMLTKYDSPDSRSLLCLVSTGRWALDGDVRVRHGFSSCYTIHFSIRLGWSLRSIWFIVGNNG